MALSVLSEVGQCTKQVDESVMLSRQGACPKVGGDDRRIRDTIGRAAYITII